MNPPNQFGSAKPARGGEGTTCAQCEAMLPDWMDHAEGGDLTEKDRAAFELHIATCAECSQMLADAQRGAALLQMLKSPRPEPSSALLDRILANTSGVAGPAKSRASSIMTLPAFDGGAVEIQSVNPATYSLPSSLPQAPAALAGNVLPFPRPVASPGAGRFKLRAVTHTMMQPRLAMTAAMAFFSIALTLNLTGVRLNELSISDLKPSNIRRTFYQADASVVRYYDNLRVVYELESRVQDMKRSSDGNSSDADGSPSGTKAGAESGTPKDKPKTEQQRKGAPKAGSGTSQRFVPLQQNFKLAMAQWPGTPPNATLLRPLALTSFLERNTAVAVNKLTETEQEGVLA